MLLLFSGILKIQHNISLRVLLGIHFSIVGATGAENVILEVVPENHRCC